MSGGTLYVMSYLPTDLWEHTHTHTHTHSHTHTHNTHTHTHTPLPPVAMHCLAGGLGQYGWMTSSVLGMRPAYLSAASGRMENITVSTAKMPGSGVLQVRWG